MKDKGYKELEILEEDMPHDLKVAIESVVTQVSIMEEYKLEEIHHKENSKGELVIKNYTVVQEEIGTNGRYVHRIGENGTMFATGKPGIKTNLKTRLVRV